MRRGRIESRDVLLYKDGGRPGEFEPHVSMFGDGFPFAECAINEHVYRLRANDRAAQSYLYFWLSDDATMAEMRVKGTGVAIPGLNSTNAKSLTTLIPPARIVSRFDTLVEPLIARILANCTNSRLMAEVRDALLPKLLSGQLRTTDTERSIDRPGA
jgi:type I restriction enzyme S subunit